MSNITLNIVEPGSGPTPDPVVPNTGLFTRGIGGTEATIIAVSTILVLALVAFVVWYYKKHTNIHVTNIIKHIKTRKSIAIGLTVLAILVSAGTFASLLINAGKSNTNAAEGEDDSSLTVDVSSEELTIELADEPVFAVLPVEVSVEEATRAGYTLTAYADSTDLVSTTDPDNTIPMIAVEGDELEALTDNTYGLSLVEPESESDKVYTSLPTESENAVIIKTFEEYTPTAANDTTTIYYGFYITPNIPYGTYTNDSEVYYDATINTTLVTFDGNGLYFNDDEQQTTNEVEYVAVPEEGKEYTINQPISGEYKTPSQDLPYNFLGWSTDPEATVPTYETEEKIAEFLPISPNTPITLYAVWQKATTITFDNNGGAGEMDKQTIIAGETNSLNPNTFTRDGYHFTGWNTVAEPTEQDPGKAYEDQADFTAPDSSADITLYAQWEEDILYMQDVANWGSTLAQGDEITAVDSRDGTEYTVARLADNNIWMTQNLDLNIEAGRTYTSADTDLANSSISTTWTPTSSEATYPTGTTTWNSSTTVPESYDPGDLYWNGAFIYDKETCEANGGWWYIPQYQSGECRDANPTASIGDIHYHIGNYYNWTAAVAMSNSSSYTSGGVDQSICPAGWRLPNLSENKSYQNLVDTLSLSAGTGGNIQNSPVYFVYGGYWRGKSWVMGGSGYYWPSVGNGSSNVYEFRFNVYGNLYPQTIGTRYFGYSVRCVAR